jgi:hypothetical protein
MLDNLEQKHAAVFENASKHEPHANYTNSKPPPKLFYYTHLDSIQYFYNLQYNEYERALRLLIAISCVMVLSYLYKMAHCVRSIFTWSIYRISIMKICREISSTIVIFKIFVSEHLK